MIRSILCAKEMSASENQAAETSKDTDYKKAGPRNIIRIRLPPRKRLSNGLLTLSKKVPQDTNNSRSKRVPEQTNHNPSKKLITSAVQSEASSNSPREGLCNVANSNTLINIELPEVASDSNISKNLTISTGVRGDNASICPAKEVLCEEANNIPHKALAVPVKELAAKPISNTLSKFLTTTGVQGEEANINTPSKNLTTTRVQGEENNNSPRKRLLYDTDNNTPSKVGHEEAKDNITSRNLPTTGFKYEELFEQANNHIPAKRLSDEAKNHVLSNRSTDPHPANKSSPLKKLCASAVQATGNSKNTYEMKLTTSAGKAVERSTNAANLEAIKEYQEFEEKVKQTVYLDNLSPQVTEAVITSALSQFGTLRKVKFLVNYTIPYDIPQSALVEMETEKDSESVISMLHDFPFMMSGMPRPVRAKRATAEMFTDRPRRPGRKLEFRWVGPTDPDHVIVKKLKVMSRRHEVENFALIEHELEEEKLLAERQQENLNCNYVELETVAGMVNHMSHIYSINCGELF